MIEEKVKDRNEKKGNNEGRSEIMIFLNEFLLDLSSKNFSQNTIRAYEKDISDFLEFSGAEKVDDIRSSDIESFVVYVLRSGGSSATAERKLASIKSFFGFLERKGKVKRNPAELVPFRKRKKRIPDVLDEEEALKLTDSEDERDRAIISLLYGCGLRISELANLKVQDIDPAGFIKVKGKGGKWRKVPVPPPAMENLKKYLDAKKIKEGFIFLNRYGKKLSERYIREIVRRNGALKTGKRVWPHLLRHSCATHILKNGGDIRIIQELLGHSSINTTQKYIHADLRYILSLYKKTHPREKIDKK